MDIQVRKKRFASRYDVGPRVTHVLGIVVVNLRGASGNTLYWASLGMMWGTFINGFKIIFF
jgi:hypothetical protein